MVSVNRKMAGVALVGAAAAAIGLGVSAGARAADSAATPNPTSTTSTGTPSPQGTVGVPGDLHGKGWGPGGRPGGGFRNGGDLSALASKLGVSESTLKDALRAVKQELAGLGPGRKGAIGGAKPDLSAVQDQFAQKLASKLGIDVNKVKAALAGVRADAEAARQKAFDDRLDQAVKDGKLTQAEANAVKKAAKAGIIEMEPGPR